MKTYGGVDVWIHIFLTSALRGEWSDSRPGRFTHWGNSPWYPLDRRLGRPQSRSGRRGENSWPYLDSNSDPSVVQPVASHYSGPRHMYTKTRVTDKNYSSGKHDAVTDGDCRRVTGGSSQFKEQSSGLGPLTTQHNNFKAKRLQRPSDTKGDGEE
jgi:hypothetical protein